MDTTSILSTSVEESQTIQIQTEYQNIRVEEAPLEDRENAPHETTENAGVTFVPLGTETSSFNTIQSVLSTERYISFLKVKLLYN